MGSGIKVGVVIEHWSGGVLPDTSGGIHSCREKGLRLGLTNITAVMLMRSHKYGHNLDRSVSINDCVHWCMPGPVEC